MEIKFNIVKIEVVDDAGCVLFGHFESIDDCFVFSALDKETIFSEGDLMQISVKLKQLNA
jgi:hypothetical protein